MFSCPKGHLTPLEEFCTLPVPVRMQLQPALERASLSSLFLSLPFLLLSQNIFWALTVCRALGYLHWVFLWWWCFFFPSHAACGPNMLGSVQCVQWKCVDSDATHLEFLIPRTKFNSQTVFWESAYTAVFQKLCEVMKLCQTLGEGSRPQCSKLCGLLVLQSDF